MSNLADDAFAQLYPNKTGAYTFTVKYSAQFKGYNANVKKFGARFEFNLSRQWETVSPDIQIGLIQSLFLKIFRDQKTTTNIELYSLFMRNVHLAIPKIKNDSVLSASFERNNEQFFLGTLEQPNLEWGHSSIRKLACYHYGTDTITVSTIFKNADQKLLDYVMYHEMLHKHLKFSNTNGRSNYHSPQFRKMEQEFPESARLEQELGRLAAKSRWKFF